MEKASLDMALPSPKRGGIDWPPNLVTLYSLSLRHQAHLCYQVKWGAEAEPSYQSLSWATRDKALKGK